MKDAQKPDHISLNTLVNRLQEGRYVIPDFQREFEWEPWDIKELMRSIFLDYYIGSLLLWKGKDENFKSLSCESIYGYEGDNNPEYIVLDGQQRLTAIFYAFLAPDIPLPNRASRAYYFIQIDHFINEEYDESFSYEWLTQRLKRMLDDRNAQYEQHSFPIHVIGDGGWELANWVQGYEQYWKNKAEQAQLENDNVNADIYCLHAENGHAFGRLLKDITEQYQISYIELDSNLSVDKICDIFTQINSRGIRLDAFDLINALLKPKGLQLKHMWREAAPGLSFVETERMNVYVLQVMSILLQSYCSPKYLYFLLPGQEKSVRNPDGSSHKEVLIPDISEFSTQWEEAVQSIRDAISLLQHPQEFGVISSNYLPYVTILPIFASLQNRIKKLPHNKRLDAQRKARHWYWASIFTNRYSGSVESTSARDFIDVTAWFDDDVHEPGMINDFKLRFNSLDLRKEIRRGTSIYNAIFNLLVIQGARDWMTGNIPQYGDLDDHHIVPASWGEKNLKDSNINTILNRTPLSLETNRQIINNRLPNEYLPELIEANGRQQVETMMQSHFISNKALDILLRNPFSQQDFEEFITERHHTILHAIENLLIKERLDLPPKLRDIDAQVEEIELKLRNLMSNVLDGQVEQVPQHIMVKVEERIQKAVQKNPALENGITKTLNGKLEYFDLREVQDSITSKKLWIEFTPIFKNKENLNTRFNQLAEIRNSIRHSRSVDAVTLKDGEAAILWFTQTLKGNI